MSIPKKILFFCLSAFLVNNIIAQPNPKVDSLLQELKHYQNKSGIAADTTVYNIYMALGNEFQKTLPDSAIVYYTLAQNKAKQFKNPIKQAEAIRNKGWCFFIISDYIKALHQYELALKILEQTSLPKEEERTKKSIVAKINGNIGPAYHEQGNFAKALDYYFKALAISEEMGDKRSQATKFGNIGLVYAEQGNYVKALNYYLRASAINEEMGNKRNQALNLGNIGNVYHNQGKYSKALDYYFKALTINEEIGNKGNQALNLGNIGIVYFDQGNYAKALDYYFKTLAISEEIGDKRSQALNLENIGAAYLQQKQYSLAEKHILQAIQMGKELKIIYPLKDFYQSLSELYTQTHQYQQALEAYEQHIAYKDSVNSEENQKALATKEMQYLFDKQQTEERAMHQQEMLKKDAQQKQQKLFTYLALSVAAAILIILFIVFKSLKSTKKQKQIIELAHFEISKQKKIVEEKNKDILDSINYAKRIQNAILPNENKWKSLFPNSFILYLPKDIVAGDFYWLEETENYIYIAAADCTGHGVPGAMVSVICSNALTKAVLEDKKANTDEILNRTREIVIEKLSGSETQIQDGMDVCLIRIDKKDKSHIQFSGANRAVWIVNASGKLEEFKADKEPIGNYEGSKPFNAQRIHVENNSKIYLTTDGFADQFGGEKDKKFSVKLLKEMLIKMPNKPLLEQHTILHQAFKNWKGNNEQIDDITILGIEV